MNLAAVLMKDLCEILGNLLKAQRIASLIMSLGRFLPACKNRNILILQAKIIDNLVFRHKFTVCYEIGNLIRHPVRQCEIKEIRHFRDLQEMVERPVYNNQVVYTTREKQRRQYDKQQQDEIHCSFSLQILPQNMKKHLVNSSLFDSDSAESLQEKILKNP